jgi:ABC-2 type transport system permease protein
LIFAIARKELKTLFTSPMAWAVLTFMQLILAYFFLRRVQDYMEIQAQLIQMPNPPGVTELVIAPLYLTIVTMMLFVVPLLTMRLIAEERRNQTMVFLISAPLSMTQIVIGKFTGLTAFLLLIIGITTLMPLSLLLAGQLDFGLLASLISGVALLAACFVAIGLYASCLTVHPFIAAVVSFCILLALLLAGDAAVDGLKSRGWTIAAALAQVLSPFKNFEPFGKGVIDSYAIACLLLLMVLFLILTIRRLDAARLRG